MLTPLQKLGGETGLKSSNERGFTNDGGINVNTEGHDNDHEFVTKNKLGINKQ